MDEMTQELEDLASRLDAGCELNVYSALSKREKRLEDYHSDILKSFLDPELKLNVGRLLLRRFVELLDKIRRASAVQSCISEFLKDIDTSSISVFREEPGEEPGRADLVIRDNDRRISIVIENKITGAHDMQRQLPRYLLSERHRGYKVVALVYLKPYAANAFPETDGWREGEIEEVRRVFVPLAAMGNPNSLVDGWLKPVADEISNGHQRTALSLYQYIEYLQGGLTAVADWNRFCALTAQPDVMCAASPTVHRIFERRYKYVLHRILESSGKSVFCYGGMHPKRATEGEAQIVTFQGWKFKVNGHPVELGVDISSLGAQMCVKFWPRADAGSVVRSCFAQKVKDVMQLIDHDFQIVGNGAFKLLVNAAKVYDDVDAFVAKIARILNALTDKRNEIESSLNVL